MTAHSRLRTTVAAPACQQKVPLRCAKMQQSVGLLCPSYCQGHSVHGIGHDCDVQDKRWTPRPLVEDGDVLLVGLFNFEGPSSSKRYIKSMQTPKCQMLKPSTMLDVGPYSSVLRPSGAL